MSHQGDLKAAAAAPLLVGVTESWNVDWDLKVHLIPLDQDVLTMEKKKNNRGYCKFPDESFGTDSTCGSSRINLIFLCLFLLHDVDT